MNSQGMLDFMSNKKQPTEELKGNIIHMFMEIEKLKKDYETIKSCQFTKETFDSIKLEMNQKIKDIMTEMHDTIDMIGLL